MNDDPSHIINALAKESRKFGVGLILATQNQSHFPEDVATCCSTRLILGVDEQFHDRLGKMYGLKPDRFRQIVPKKTALFQMKSHNAEATTNGFVDVLL